MKRRIRLTESELRKVVGRAVRKALNEAGRPPLVTRSGEFPFVRKGELPELSDDDAAELRSELDSRFGKWSGLDTDMPVVVVGGEYEGEYTLGDVMRDLPVVGFEGPSNNRRLGMRTAGLPRIKGYVGPMVDGDRIRYESQEANDFFSI